MSTTPQDPVARITSIRSTTLFGVSALALFMGTFGAWAVAVPISGAVVAGGQVVTDHRVQIVRHERGGVLESVDVKEGDMVKAGQTLAVLSRSDDRAAREELIARVGALAARQARLTIEQSGDRDAHVTLLDVFASTDGLSLANLEALVADQNEVLATRRRQLDDTLDILRTQKTATEQERTGLEGELAALRAQLASIGEDITLRKEAATAGLGRKSALRELERQSETIRGSIAKSDAALQRYRHDIEQFEQKMAATRSEFMGKVTDELSRVRAERLEAQEALNGRNADLARVKLKAPVSGIVNRININTIGSAVEPFAPLVEIVAEDQQAVIEVRVQPPDIDDVYPTQHARIVMTAFNRHLIDPVTGRVTFVAADARLDEATRQPYFTVRLTIDKEAQAGLPAIVPGMPAEAYLLKQDRTFVGYMAEPFIQSFYRAFRQ